MHRRRAGGRGRAARRGGRRARGSSASPRRPTAATPPVAHRVAARVLDGERGEVRVRQRRVLALARRPRLAAAEARVLRREDEVAALRAHPVARPPAARRLPAARRREHRVHAERLPLGDDRGPVDAVARQVVEPRCVYTSSADANAPSRAAPGTQPAPPAPVRRLKPAAPWPSCRCAPRKARTRAPARARPRSREELARRRGERRAAAAEVVRSAKSSS